LGTLATEEVVDRKWADAPYDRKQLTLMSPSVDEMVVVDHPIRYFECLLESLDWREWEMQYKEGRGQPPIHPRLVAGAILWGLMHRVRSSRGLEDATKHRIDFMWFLEGRTIDHATFSNFRNRFPEALKGLSAELTRQALKLAGSSAANVGVDGTLVRANSDWRGSKTAESLERALRQLGLEVEELLAEMAASDEQTAQTEDLKRQLEAANREREKLQRALEVAQERDAKKNKSQAATKVPVTDPDAVLLKNKDGGYAPNYAPVVAVDLDSGIVVHDEVLQDKSEAKSLPDVVESCERELGKAPEKIVADGGFCCGATLKELAERGVETYVPSQDLNNAEVAQRPDLGAAVAAEKLGQLPLRGGRFGRAAFVYDPESDCYYCPAGQVLSLYRTLSNSGKNREVATREYRTNSCFDCPLAAQCVRSKSKRRTISRDELADHREASAERLRTDSGKALYKRRAPVVEGVFAVIKHVMGIRRFLTRGHENVETEWRWITTAYNLKKILKLVAGNPLCLPTNPKNAPVCNPAASFRPFFASQPHCRATAA